MPTPTALTASDVEQHRARVVAPMKSDALLNARAALRCAREWFENSSKGEQYAALSAVANLQRAIEALEGATTR